MLAINNKEIQFLDARKSIKSEIKDMKQLETELESNQVYLLNVN